MEDNSTEKALIEVSTNQSDKVLTARAVTWDVALAEISVGVLKTRIATHAKNSFVFDRPSETWLIHLDEEKGKAGERIALFLLFHYPRRVSRDAVSYSTEIKSDSLATYLSKSKPETNDNIDENKEGVTLNEKGFHWAVEILDSLKVK